MTSIEYKVFIITSGEYSDYHVIKCCNSRERAEQFIEDTITEDYHETMQWYKEKAKNIPEYQKDWWNPRMLDGTMTLEEYKKNHHSQFEIEEYEVLQ